MYLYTANYCRNTQTWNNDIALHINILSLVVNCHNEQFVQHWKVIEIKTQTSDWYVFILRLFQRWDMFQRLIFKICSLGHLPYYDDHW